MMLSGNVKNVWFVAQKVVQNGKGAKRRENRLEVLLFFSIFTFYLAVFLCSRTVVSLSDGLLLYGDHKNDNDYDETHTGRR